MVCGSVLTGQQKAYDGSIERIIASRCWLTFISYSCPYLPSQNFFLLKMVERGAALQGTARLAKVLEIHFLIQHSRNRIGLTYRKSLDKSNKKLVF